MSRISPLFVAALMLASSSAILHRHTLPVLKWSKNSKHRIAAGDVESFAHAAQGDDDIAMLCQVGAEIGRTLPNKLKRKELFEAHAVACLVLQQVESHLCEFDTFVDLCAGCGLLGLFLALKHPRNKVVAMDRKQSALSMMLHDTATTKWPDLASRFTWELRDLRPTAVAAQVSQPILLPSRSIVVACHACGLLTDEAIAAASFKQHPLVVLPCCYPRNPKLHRVNPGHPGHSWQRLPWLQDGSVNRVSCDAIDDARIDFLRSAGYSVRISHIDRSITKFNKAIIASPQPAI
mmetsp:Transcript_36840/g.68619  ORF Transcript_36840/g.68619 Transcript_36840/m.68619 type:complete len:292 (-) Transcript_36840:105-980(-)